MDACIARERRHTHARTHARTRTHTHTHAGPGAHAAAGQGGPRVRQGLPATPVIDSDETWNPKQFSIVDPFTIGVRARVRACARACVRGGKRERWTNRDGEADGQRDSVSCVSSTVCVVCLQRGRCSVSQVTQRPLLAIAAARLTSTSLPVSATPLIWESNGELKQRDVESGVQKSRGRGSERERGREREREYIPIPREAHPRGARPRGTQ